MNRDTFGEKRAGGVEGVAAQVKRLLKRLRPLPYSVYLWRLVRASGRHPVIVNSMGKVGSKALAAAVPLASSRGAVHVHRMAGFYMWDGARWQRLGPRSQVTSFIRDHPQYRHDHWRGAYLRRRIEWSAAGVRWDVITGVREPVAQSVSHFFHVADDRGDLDRIDPSSETDVQSLATEIVESMWDHVKADWFAAELLNSTGIDVYESPFPHDIGWTTYANSKFDVLLLRFEDLHRVAPEALQAFLRVERPVPIPRENVGSNKRYSDLYRATKDALAVPQELLDAAYGTRWAKHFYTEEETRAFRKRWLA